MKLPMRQYLITMFIDSVVYYPAARTQPSDSSIDDFKMVVYENIFGHALDKKL